MPAAGMQSDISSDDELFEEGEGEQERPPQQVPPLESGMDEFVPDFGLGVIPQLPM